MPEKTAFAVSERNVVFGHCRVRVRLQKTMPATEVAVCAHAALHVSISLQKLTRNCLQARYPSGNFLRVQNRRSSVAQRDEVHPFSNAGALRPAEDRILRFGVASHFPAQLSNPQAGSQHAHTTFDQQARRNRHAFGRHCCNECARAGSYDRCDRRPGNRTGQRANCRRADSGRQQGDRLHRRRHHPRQRPVPRSGSGSGRPLHGDDPPHRIPAAHSRQCFRTAQPDRAPRGSAHASGHSAQQPRNQSFHR